MEMYDPTCIAAICDGGLFPNFVFDDSCLVRRFSSLAMWRFDHCKKIDPTCVDCCECLAGRERMFFEGVSNGM